MTKPIKPNITIPEAFAVNGQKADFLDEKIQNGFSNVDPDVLAGDNLNKLIDDTYKGLNYSMDGVSDLYKSVITYDSAETYGLNSIVFNIEEEGVALYQSLIADNTGNALTDEAKWKKLELGGGGAGQPIGSLFWSFATAAYVPDYALACDGTEYSSAMFTGLWNSYLTADVPKLLTKNYTQYQADITEYGSCAAFGVEHSISAVHSGTTITEVAVTTATWENKVSDVGEYVFSYDGANWSLNSEVVTLADYGVILTGEAASGDTVTVTYAYGTHFKVPKINNTIYQGVTETVPVVGNGKTLGCTGINSSSIAVNFGTIYSAADGFNGRSDAYGANISYKNVSGDVGQLGNIGVTTDGEKSGLVAKLSDNVATITLRCFVVVANKSDNEAEFDWSQWASSLAGKANIDAVDGPWTAITSTELATEVSINSSPMQLDLSEILPVDNYRYLLSVILSSIETQTGIAINVYGETSDVDNVAAITALRTQVNTSPNFLTCGNIICGPDRKVYIRTTSGTAKATLQLFGYRRLGN